MTDQLLSRGFSAATLRLAIFVVGGAVMTVPLQEGTTFGAIIVLLPAVLASAYAPASPAPAIVVVTTAILVALGGDDPLRAEVLILIPLVHLFHVTCGIAGFVPARGRLHLAALRAPARRFLLVQAVVLGLALLVGLLPIGRTAVPFEVLGLLGLAGLAALVIRLQRVD